MREEQIKTKIKSKVNNILSSLKEKKIKMHLIFIILNQNFKTLILWKLDWGRGCSIWKSLNCNKCRRTVDSPYLTKHSEQSSADNKIEDGRWWSNTIMRITYDQFLGPFLNYNSKIFQFSAALWLSINCTIKMPLKLLATESDDKYACFCY